MMVSYDGKTWGGPFPGIGGHPRAWFFVSSPDNVKHVLSDKFKQHEKGEYWLRIFGDLLGNGIFNTDGQQWAIHRKVQANMFSRNLLREYSKSFKSIIAKAGAWLDELIATSNKKPAVTVDIQDFFFRLTFASISYVAFGLSANSFESDSQHPFAKAFDEMQGLIRERIVDPIYKIKKLFQATKNERRIRQLKKILDSNANDFINLKRRTVEEGSKIGPDLLSRYIEHSKKNNAPIDNTELRDIIMNILVAGRDTTACALSWALFELTKRPDVVKRIVEEVNSNCPNEDFSYDKLNGLKYTNAVIMEVLRLHPSVPVDSKIALEDSTLPDGTFVPAGSGVSYLIFGMGRNKRIWGEDVLEFKPERFLDRKEPSTFEYPVFNVGPRLCLGKPLAVATMKIALAYLLPRYEFVDSLGHSGDATWTLVLSMKGGFPLEVKRRKVM